MKKGNHNIVTWQDAARLLHALRPRTYTTWALGKIFNKNLGTIYYALHPEKRREMDQRRDKLPQRKAQKAAALKRRKARRRELNGTNEHNSTQHQEDFCS